MRRILIAFAAGILIAAAAATVHARRDREPAGPYRMVMIDNVMQSMSRKAGERFMDSPNGTLALNQLQAAGYEVVAMGPSENGKTLVILRQAP